MRASDNVYNVTVVATDNGVDTATDTDGDGENKMMATRDVIITVTNVEEAGTVKLSAQQPKAGVTLTASVTDLDGGVTGMKWQWSWATSATAADEAFTDIATRMPTRPPTHPLDGDVGPLPAGDGDLHGQQRWRS